MAKKQTLRLYADVKRDFARLSEVKEFGVQKHTNAWILAYLGEKYYRSPKTIENIVFGRTTAVASN